MIITTITLPIIYLNNFTSQLVEDSNSGNHTIEAFNKSSLKQQYFRGHSDDILCLTIDKSRRFLATGQTAAKGLL